MGQLDFHKNLANKVPPPQHSNSNELPLLTKLNDSYKLWHGFLTHLPRLTRYTLGGRIDGLFIDCFELALTAGYAARSEKLEFLRKLSIKIDTLKFFLKLLWELKALDNSKYSTISMSLAEIGKMIGGWMKLFKNETPL